MSNKVMEDIKKIPTSNFQRWKWKHLRFSFKGNKDKLDKTNELDDKARKTGIKKKKGMGKKWECTNHLFLVSYFTGNWSTWEKESL